MAKIPLVDLEAHHKPLLKQIYRSIHQVVLSNKFIMGKEVQLFEEEFARFCKARYSVGTGNGTLSIHVALSALGIGKGDEVITVANTFIATTESISQTGAKIVFCDIDSSTQMIDPEALVNKITSKTKAIICVHLFGNTCQMDVISEIAKKHRLFVIEDAAQAHGAVYKGKNIGTWGDVATYSFFPSKNLGAWGDAGAVVTNDKKLYTSIKKLVNHGRKDKYIHDLEGYNYRLDAIQAAILRVKLPQVQQWNKLRREHAKYYHQLFAGIPEVKCVEETRGGTCVYHLFVITHPKREKIRANLARQGIETGIHYPLPLHLQPAYRYLGYKKGDLPKTEEKSLQILSLPMYPELTKRKIETIVHYVKKALS